MRRNLIDTTRDLEQARKHLQGLERDAADRERDLIRFKADRMWILQIALLRPVNPY